MRYTFQCACVVYSVAETSGQQLLLGEKGPCLMLTSHIAFNLKTSAWRPWGRWSDLQQGELAFFHDVESGRSAFDAPMSEPDGLA